MRVPSELAKKFTDKDRSILHKLQNPERPSLKSYRYSTYENIEIIMGKVLFDMTLNPKLKFHKHYEKIKNDFFDKRN